MNAFKAIYFSTESPLMEAFYAVRKAVYGNDVKPDEINQKYLLTCLLITFNNEPVGRACLYKNPMIEEGKTLLFGNVECINNQTTFEQLIKEIESYATANNFASITGPINGSTWDDYRLPLTNFGTRFITDLPQPAYYAEYLQQTSFLVSQHYFTHHSFIEERTTDPLLINRMHELEILIRNIDMHDYENELKKLHHFCTIMFADNVLYSPINQKDFVKKYLQIKSIIQAEFVMIAEDKRAQIQGFMFCIPDPYQKDKLVIKTIARNVKDDCFAGLMTYIADVLHNRAYAKGFRHLLHAFMHSNNRSKALSEKYGGQVIKEYALFSKKLTS